MYSKKLDNYIVNKPWGNEYVICKNKRTATWLLNIGYKKKTSLHCHPKKKTGFILLSGSVEVMLGFYDKRILKAPSKLMIRPGLFHSTKALSKKGAVVLEIETPINKDDLVRYKDSYGRENKPYEGINKMRKKDKSTLIFQIPKLNNINNYKFNNLKITLEKHSQTKNLINRSKNTIFAVLDGGLSDKKNQLVLSPGDIVRTDTVKKLSKVFKINKEMTILTCKKNNEYKKKN